MQSMSHESDDPGWCSNPSKKLSRAAIDAIDAGAGNDLKESDLVEYEVLEKAPGSLGDRTLVQYYEEGLADPNADPNYPDDTISRLWFVEDAQEHVTKYGHAKFGKRLEAMHKAAMSIDVSCNACPGFDNESACDAAGDMVTVLLLGAKQPICRTNCIPALSKAGIVIQRRED
jgi:hypothetical protein